MCTYLVAHLGGVPEPQVARQPEDLDAGALCGLGVAVEGHEALAAVVVAMRQLAHGMALQGGEPEEEHGDGERQPELQPQGHVHGGRHQEREAHDEEVQGAHPEGLTLDGRWRWWV